MTRLLKRDVMALLREHRKECGLRVLALRKAHRRGLAVAVAQEAYAEAQRLVDAVWRNTKKEA